MNFYYNFQLLAIGMWWVFIFEFKIATAQAEINLETLSNLNWPQNSV